MSLALAPSSLTLALALAHSLTLYFYIFWPAARKISTDQTDYNQIRATWLPIRTEEVKWHLSRPIRDRSATRMTYMINRHNKEWINKIIINLKKLHQWREKVNFIKNASSLYVCQCAATSEKCSGRLNCPLHFCLAAADAIGIVARISHRPKQ